MRKQGTPPIRPGYVLVGWCKSFWHRTAKRRIVAPDGKSFPIWRKINAA